MDPVTHGLLGAAAASLAARRDHVRRALIAGIAGALVPDLDVLVFASDADPLREIELHRHFTHSLAFVPAGGLIAASVLFLLSRGRWAFLPLWLFAALGTLTAGVLDACTGFGTHLLWPFSNARTAFGIVSIVDPVVTLALLVAVAVAAKRRAKVAAAIGLATVGAYFGLALLQQGRAHDALIAHARSAGHPVDRALVRPTLANVLVWRGVYQSGERFHTLAVRAGAGAPRVYPGGSVMRVAPATYAGGRFAGTVQGRDIERFTRFSDDWLVAHPRRPEVLGDIRFSMLPHGTEPLWGIALDPSAPDRHVRFLNFRATDAGTRSVYAAMLRGTDLP